MIAGAPVRGSWWAHPGSHRIFAALEELDQHHDTLTTRLVNRKVTFLHRELWPDFLAVAMSGESWQTRGLPADARRLFQLIRRSGETRSKGKPSRALQERLLVHGSEVHTESGRHETLLQSWERWIEQVGIEPNRDVATAKRRLEDAAARLGAPVSALPWNRG